MKAHSKLGASSYYRWSKCPASVRLSEGMPNIESDAAKEGTRAHDLAEKVLRQQKVSWDDYPEDMVDAVDVYIDYVSQENIAADYFGVEERFELTNLHPDFFGTSDCVILKDKTLQVIDYKHGEGIVVEVENNGQLLYYALGALTKLKLPCAFVEMVIVQPRAVHPDGPIRKWKIPATDLLDFSADLVEAAKRTEDPDAPIVPGDHCRFCPAAPTCPKLHETALVTAQEEFSPVFSYDPKHLAEVLTKIPAIEAWAKSVKEFAFHEAQAGRIPPGYKLVPKRASRKWKEDVNVEEHLSTFFDIDPQDMFRTKIKSPAQIEKLLAKEDKKLLDHIVVKESSGNTLAPVSDKRKATKPAIETEFTKITEGDL